jgi:sugar phosphate isomerase/epimerase
MARVTAISSLGWPHYTLYEALPRMQARGFRRIEIASFKGYCFHFNHGSPDPPELRAMLHELGLTPICLNFSGSRTDAWRDEDCDLFIRETTRKMEQLGEVGIPMITLPFGERNDRPDQEAQLLNAVRVFDHLGQVGKEVGVRTVIEAPHLYTIMPRPEQVLWVLERLSSDNVGILVDSSHWGIIGYNAEAFFRRLGSRLWHAHLRDSTGPDTADRTQQLELTPGRGSADFRALGAALDRVGYRGDVSLEFEHRDMTFEAIEREYDFGIRHLVACGWELPPNVRY